MKKVLLSFVLLFGFTVMGSSFVGLFGNGWFDYQAHFNTNSAINNYDDMSMSWAAIGIMGDITKDVSGFLLYNLSPAAPSIWYAYMTWTPIKMLGITAGMQDSLFGQINPMIPPASVVTISYKKPVDLGLTASLNLEILSISVQAVQGMLTSAMLAGTYGASITATRRIPTFQAKVELTPLKGLAIGGAGRLETYYVTPNTNTTIGVEGYLNLAGASFLPALGVKVDYAMFLNSYTAPSSSNTNWSGFYLVADVNYAIGPVTPGVRFTMIDTDSAASVTNDLNQTLDIYADIKLSEDGFAKITPQLTLNMVTAGSSTPAETMYARVRFDYMFNIPLMK